MHATCAKSPSHMQREPSPGGGFVYMHGGEGARGDRASQTLFSSSKLGFSEMSAAMGDETTDTTTSSSPSRPCHNGDAVLRALAGLRSEAIESVLPRTMLRVQMLTVLDLNPSGTYHPMPIPVRASPSARDQGRAGKHPTAPCSASDISSAPEATRPRKCAALL